MANINFVVKNDIELKGNLIFEGSTDNEFETTLAITNPTADRTITFPDGSGTVALTSIDVIAAKTGAYSVASGDEGDLIQLNGTFTVSIPTDATFNFAIGTQINLLNIGTGTITVAAVTPGTTTLNGTPGLKLRAQWSSATLIKRSANTWVLVGDLAP